MTDPLVITSIILLNLALGILLYWSFKGEKIAKKWANYALDAQAQLAGDSNGRAEFESMKKEYDKDFNSQFNF